MNNAKIVLNALKRAERFLETLRNLHGAGALLPTTPESDTKQFFKLLDGVGESCQYAIAILESESLTDGAGAGVSGPKILH